MKVYLNGAFIDENDAKISINDAGILYGQGVYETFRTYGGRLKLFSEHFERLKNSAKSLYIPLNFSESQLITTVTELVKARKTEEPEVDFLIRITLTAGKNNLRMPCEQDATVFITATSLHETPAQPISMCRFEMIRQLPSAKSTAMLPAILGQNYALSRGYDEALLIDDKETVYEGSFSNVYLIKNGVLKYPATGVLNGVTKDMLIKLTKDLIPSQPDTLTLKDFYDADEVFTSGSVRGVVPVIKINNKKVLNNTNYTQQIQKIYENWSKR